MHATASSNADLRSAAAPRGSDAAARARELLARTVALTPSDPKWKLARTLGEYRAVLHALVASENPPQDG